MMHGIKGQKGDCITGMPGLPGPTGLPGIAGQRGLPG